MPTPGAYSPAIRQRACSPFLGTFSYEGYHSESIHNATAPASAAYPTTNQAYYHPIVVPKFTVIYRFFWLNGATVGTNNIQVGIYNDNDAGTDGPGNAILRGTSTLSAGANICQFDDVTNTALGPGLYWLGIWCSGTTATLFRSTPSNIHGKMTGAYTEAAGAGGLPATATPAQLTTPYIPVYGFTTISAP